MYYKSHTWKDVISDILKLNMQTPVTWNQMIPLFNRGKSRAKAKIKRLLELNYINHKYKLQMDIMTEFEPRDAR